MHSLTEAMACARRVSSSQALVESDFLRCANLNEKLQVVMHRIRRMPVLLRRMTQNFNREHLTQHCRLQMTRSASELLANGPVNILPLSGNDNSRNNTEESADEATERERERRRRRPFVTRWEAEVSFDSADSYVSSRNDDAHKDNTSCEVGDNTSLMTKVVSRQLTWYFRTRCCWHGGPPQRASAGCQRAHSGTTSRSPRTSRRPRVYRSSCASRGQPQQSSGGTHPGQDDLWKIHMTA